MPYYAGSGGSVVVDNADGLSLNVTITEKTGAPVTVYSDDTRSTSVTFPDAITGSKTYYLPTNGEFIISTKVGTVEIAGSVGNTVTALIRGGNSFVFRPSIDRAEQTAIFGGAAQSGTYAPVYADSFVPAGWGSLAWRAKLAAARAGTGKAVVAIHGDSVGRGYHASNLDTKSWAGLLATTLRTGADGGTGFKSVFDSTVFMAARSLPAAQQTAYTNAGNLISLTGTWTEYSGPSGPGGALLQSTVASSTATFTVRGTSGYVYWVGSSTGPGFEYQIDGGSFTAVATTGYQQNKTALPTMSSGTHTVVIRYPAAGTGTLYLNGVSAENSTGVVVNQFSRYGATTATYDTTDAIASGDWNGGQKYPADLLVYAVGLNDNGGGTSSDTAMLNAARVIRSARDKGGRNGDVDILVIVNHCGSYNTSPNDKWHDYALKLRQLAVSHHAAYVDLWAAGRNSYNYWTSLGYWGNSTSPGAAGTDGVHLSDVGHQAVYNTIVGAVPTLVA